MNESGQDGPQVRFSFDRGGWSHLVYLDGAAIAATTSYEAARAAIRLLDNRCMLTCEAGKISPDVRPVMRYPYEKQARAAYEQFASEPHPEGFKESYPEWPDLAQAHKELWFRVATAVLNGEPVR